MKYVTTVDGRHWSAEAVAQLQATCNTIMAQRDRAQFDLAILHGKIHTLDREQS